MEETSTSTEERRIVAQWGPVWRRTAGATAVGLVTGAVLARRRLRLGFSEMPAGGTQSLLAAAAAKSPSTAVTSAALAGALFAGTTSGVFLTSRELLRVDMQWEGMTPSLYAGVFTGALLGAFTGGPYNALLGMSTVGGLAVVGEGAASVYNRWYNKKREEIKRQRLIERRHALVRQRAQLAESDGQQLEQIDQQLEAIAYHLTVMKGKEEVSDRQHMRSWMSLKLPSWFPIQTMTDEKQQERDKAEAEERELLNRYYAQRALEYQQNQSRAEASPSSSSVPPSESKESSAAV